AGLDGLDRLAIEHDLEVSYVNPAGNAHSNRFGLLVAQDEFPLEWQITLHVHPGRGAVQEEINLCQAVIETGDPMPGIIECRRRMERGGRGIRRLEGGRFPRPTPADETLQERVIFGIAAAHLAHR